MSAEAGAPARLADVIICSADFNHDRDVFRAITGINPMLVDNQSAVLANDAVFLLGDAHLKLTASTKGQQVVKRGIERLIIEVPDLDVTASELHDAGADTRRYSDHIKINQAWAGVLIEVRAQPIRSNKQAGAAGSVLDHVAILVADVKLMSDRWSVIVGGPPAHEGIHPLGTAVAARFLLGNRMIELVAPLPDQASPLSTRLNRFGEGPFALALIANDLNTTVAAVAESGAKLIDQPPHIIVHPSDASGVPIQLTPRVNS